MKLPRFASAAAAILALAVSHSQGGEIDEEAMAKVRAALQPGVPFPVLEVEDLNGKPVSTADWKGRVVLVDFWATWCAPCVAEIPNLQALHRKYHGQGLEMVGVSLDDDRAPLDAFLERRKLPWPQYCDGPDWRVQQRYGVITIPTTFLLDRQGIILAVGLHGEKLDQAVAAALSAK